MGFFLFFFFFFFDRFPFTPVCLQIYIVYSILAKFGENIPDISGKVVGHVWLVYIALQHVYFLRSKRLSVASKEGVVCRKNFNIRLLHSAKIFSHKS